MMCYRCRKPNMIYYHTEEPLPIVGTIPITVSMYCRDCGFIGTTIVRIVEKINSKRFECIECGNDSHITKMGYCGKCFSKLERHGLKEE